MTIESVLTKIRKALALANSSDSNEAQTAMLMAQRLMAKHNIEMSDVETEEDSKEVVVEQITNMGRTPFYKKQLSNIISENFRVTSFISMGHGKSCIRFLGLKEDVEIAKEVFNFAVNVLESTCNTYISDVRKRYKEVDANGLKNDFRTGFAKGLQAKYREQVEQLDLAPVLVQDQLVVTRAESMGLKSRKSSGGKRSGNKDAYEKGFMQGKNLGSKALTTR